MSRLTVFTLVIITPILAILLALLGLASLPANPLGVFLLFVGATYTLGVLFVVAIQRRRFWESVAGGKTLQEERGDRSLWLISLSMLLAFFVPPLEFLYFGAVLPRTAWMEGVGILLVVVGAAIFVWARHVLRKYYAGHLAVTAAQILVQSGPYRFVRHPAYAGYFWMSLGLGVGYSSLAGIAIVFLLVLPALAFRMRVEEGLLMRAFGAQYREYAARTARLFPWIW